MTSKYTTHLFIPADVRWLAEVTEGQYQYWISERIVRASVQDEPDQPFGRLFSFTDLVAFRVIKQLRDDGLSLEELRTVQPWILSHFDSASLQFRGDVYVVDDGQLSEQPSAREDRPIDLNTMVGSLIWRIGHSRELKGQIGKIECLPRVQGGEPVIAGTRVTVAAIQEFADAGFSIEAIHTEYPSVTPEDIRAAIAYSPDSSDLAAAD